MELKGNRCYNYEADMKRKELIANVEVAIDEEMEWQPTVNDHKVAPSDIEVIKISDDD